MLDTFGVNAIYVKAPAAREMKTGTLRKSNINAMMIEIVIKLVKR